MQSSMQSGKGKREGGWYSGPTEMEGDYLGHRGEEEKSSSLGGAKADLVPLEQTSETGTR